MQQAQDDENKDGRYFPSDSEMPILIHYLQVYFSHPERSIQRSQVVQNVVSILSPTNKHWNHRTIRLWFNNNKRVFYRPTSPQQLPEQNQIPPAASAPTSFSQDPEPPSPPMFAPAAIPKYYLPTRSLSVEQVPTVMNSSPEIQQPPPNMNASQWERYQRQQLREHIQKEALENPKNGSFAKYLMDIKSNFDYQTEKNPENQTTEILVLLNDQKWDRFVSEQPRKNSIEDKDSIPQIPEEKNFSSLQLILPPAGSFLTSIFPTSSTPPSPPPAPSPDLMRSPISMSNPNSPPSPSSPALSSLETGISEDSRLPFTLGVSSYDLIESSTFTINGLPIIVSYDTSVNADQIHVNLNHTSNSEDSVIETGFLSSSSSIIFDDEASHLWVRSGNFIRSFNISVQSDSEGFGVDSIQSDQTILTGPHRSYRSAMTFWERNLVLSSNSTILTWKPEFLYPSSDAPAHEEADEEEEAGTIREYFGVCLTLIVPSIDSLTTVNDYLVVASSEYHTAHIIAPNGAYANRAIGHTAGITALCNYDTNSFLTGSADQTVKFWDIRVSLAVHSLHRHKGIITSIFGNENQSSNLVFTGGTDGIVRAWDIRNMDSLFSIDVGDATPQSIFFDDNEKVLKVAVSEKCGDYFYDLGKFEYRDQNTTPLVDYGMNSIITFQCPNELK